MASYYVFEMTPPKSTTVDCMGPKLHNWPVCMDSASSKELFLALAKHFTLTYEEWLSGLKTLLLYIDILNQCSLECLVTEL